MSGALGLVLPETDPGIAEPLLRRIGERIEAAGRAGLGAWLMDDLWTVGRDTSTCPARTDAAVETTAALTRLVSLFPDLTGFIIRFGEPLESPRHWVARRDPLACDCPDCSRIDVDERRRQIVRFAEQVICVDLSKNCILRLWDLGAEGAHADVSRARAMLQAWRGDGRLMVALKHTQTDHWRYQPWNPSIREVAPPCLIELQCEREYELLGLVPNWLGRHWAFGPDECGEKGVTGFHDDLPEDWAGVYVLPRGGGWSKPHADSDIWAELNTTTALALAADPMVDPDDILADWLLGRGLPSEFHDLLGDSAERMLALRYPKVWTDLSGSLWMPAENWFRDDTFVPGALATMASRIVEAGLTDRFLAERATVTLMTGEDETRVRDLIPQNHPDTEFIRSSYRFMHSFAAWTEALWTALLAAAPLDRAAAADIVSLRLENQPLPPFRLL